MRGFDVKFIDELKSKNDIVDVVGKYVRLEQRGGNFWGKCPFHHEKTASFSVNPNGQFFYCFGCHKSGDVISFIMDIESLDFNDSVKLLAERAKMPLPEVKYDDEKIKEQKRLKQRVLEILRETALFYVRNLRSNQGYDYLEYAYSRGLSPETVGKFGMGASLDFESLPRYLYSKGYTYQEMVESRAVGEKNGRYYDPLGKRLIIPLIDQFNTVIAFAGRRIDGGKEQKYVNTRGSIVFEKGKTFFNLNNLKKVKNEKGIDSVIIVEGHLDVVSLVQAGFENVVASMGTAFTKDQARVIKRYTDKVFISFDGDFAGQKASIRGLEILQEEGLDVKVVSLPDGMDPDDVIKKQGADGYRKLLVDAMPLIDFKLDIIRRTYDVNTVDGKRKYIANAMKVIRESSSPAEQEDLLKIVRDLTGITYESLRRELYSVKETQIKEQERAPEFNDNSEDKNIVASRFVIASYLFNKPYARELRLSSLTFEIPVHKEIQQYIINKLEAGETPKFNDLYELLAPEFENELSCMAGMETGEKRFDEQMYFADCVKTLKVETLNKEIAKITKLYSAETDTERRRQLAKELTKLLAEKNKLS